MPQDFPFFLLLPEVKTCSMCCSVWTRKSSSRVASLEFTRSHAASRPDISSCFKISASRAGRSGCFSGPACKSMRSSLTKATPLPEPLCRPLASNQALVFQALACARVEVLWLDSAWDASGTTKWPEVRPGSGLMLRSCRSTAEHSREKGIRRSLINHCETLRHVDIHWYTLFLSCDVSPVVVCCFCHTRSDVLQHEHAWWLSTISVLLEFCFIDLFMETCKHDKATTFRALSSE